MSNVVNKLIFNCLVQYGNVALPKVGSLRVEGNPKCVFFSENLSDNHILLTDIIAEQGGISATEAEALYNDWLAAARREDGSIYAESVGTINARNFTVDEELHRALNGAEIPVATLKKRCSCDWIWKLAVGIAVVGAVIYLVGKCDGCFNKKVVVNDKNDVEVVTLTITVPEESAPAAAPEVTPAAPQQKSYTINPPQDGKRYNVMVGVFSIKYNARACAKQDPLGIGPENYLITPYESDMWAVVAYSTNNPEKADEVKLKYRKQQKDVWVWTRDND